MALDITNVQAGELITASLFNELIGELEKLDVRVTALEATGVRPAAVEITDVYPKPARVGDDVTILGKNFGVSTGATRIRFNGVSPTVFRVGSNDTAIICDVPELAGLAEEGSQVELTVSNAQTTAERSVTVLPVKREQLGDAGILFIGVTPNPVVPGQIADFEFSLNSDASLPATMTITPTISVGGADAGWTTSVLDATKNTLGDRRVTINPGDTKPFFVRVLIPANVNGTELVVRADGAGGGLIASSGSQTLTVGQEVEQDPTIIDLTPTRVTNGTLSGSTVSVKHNVVGEIFVEAHVTAAETYNVSFAPTASTTGWSTALFTPPANDPALRVAPADLNNPGPPAFAQTFIRVRVSPSLDAVPGQAVLTLQRTDETLKRSFTFDLAVAP
jgi:hypothetical protein